MADKWIFGWRVRSDIPFPDLLDWNGDDREPDVVFAIGTMPNCDEGWREFGPAARLGPAGEFLLRIPNVAAYLVEGRSKVTIEPILPITAPDIRTFLSGTVLAALCYNRGLLPLHASGIATPHGALLLSGDSGLGKSTLAAALHHYHHVPLLSDDLCALEFQDRETPILWPAFPRLKLWADSASSLSVNTSEAERTRADFEKFHIPVAPQHFHAAPLPLAMVVLLQRSFLPCEPKFTQLKGLAALQRRDIVHRWGLGGALGHGALIFKGLASLIASAPVFELTRYDDLTALPDLTTQLIELVKGTHG